MRYKVASFKHGKRTESEPFQSKGIALEYAREVAPNATVVTLLADQEGADHPDNAGTFFLDTIIK